MQNNPTLSTILSRTSIRHFTGEKLSEEKIETLLHAAMAAPSSMNLQPWHFIIIDDEALIKQMIEVLPYAKMLSEAGCGIVVCGDTSVYDRINRHDLEDNTLYWVQDTSAASENILLAAYAMGLGAVWTGIFPLENRISKISKLLHLPTNIVPLNIIAAGHPLATTSKVKEKWNPEKIHHNSF